MEKVFEIVFAGEYGAEVHNVRAWDKRDAMRWLKAKYHVNMNQMYVQAAKGYTFPAEND